MKTGLITAVLMVSSMYGPTQAQTSTGAAMLADNIINPATSAIQVNSTIQADSTSGDAASLSTSASSALLTSLTSNLATNMASTTAISTTTQFKDNTGVMAYVKKTYANEPILIDIARCESAFRQYDNKTGDVLHGKANAADIGVMQINEKYQLDKAAGMGYDINTVEGNVAYAQYLYDTQGAGPWSASQSCWSVAYTNAQTIAQASQSDSSQTLAVK